MISLYLHDLLPLIDPGEKPTKKLLPLVPDTFRAICTVIEEMIDPSLRAKRAKDLEDIGELPPDNPKTPAHDPSIGSFDRTPLVALGEWCKENNEPWLERACKFLIRHEGIRAEHYTYYSDCRRWRFVTNSLPERWRDTTEHCPTFMGLLAYLALEIKDRLQQIEG